MLTDDHINELLGLMGLTDRAEHCGARRPEQRKLFIITHIITMVCINIYILFAHNQTVNVWTRPMAISRSTFRHHNRHDPTQQMLGLHLRLSLCVSVDRPRVVGPMYASAHPMPVATARLKAAFPSP